MWPRQVSLSWQWLIFVLGLRAAFQLPPDRRVLSPVAIALLAVHWFSGNWILEGRHNQP
ncbi:hypothetical protein QUA69_27310 [Microcoleus sp. LAD1_D1]|uniref:hypothetical protein n=1 Tax=Microcoleus sp. LAD1_D1 TaxID=2818812 RepID=UPI002FD077CD